MENYFGDILEKAISRRDLFKIGGILGLSGLFNIGYSKNIQTSVKNYKNLSFRTIYPDTKDEITIPEGYEWKILIKWGDPLDNNDGINYQNVFEKASNHDVERQKYCFGYNNDFVGFFNFKDKTLLVVNHEYTNPEIMFKDYFLRNQPTKEEVDFIQELVKKGRKVGIFAYYKNEDRIADTCNTMSERFGIKFNGDIITDDVNNYDNDNLLITTTKTFEKMKERGIEKVILACTDSLTITGNNVQALIHAEDTAKSLLGKEKILFARYMDPSGGCFVAGGTCVFWDNYSIDLYNNKQLSIALLSHKK